MNHSSGAGGAWNPLEPVGKDRNKATLWRSESQRFRACIKTRSLVGHQEDVGTNIFLGRPVPVAQ